MTRPTIKSSTAPPGREGDNPVTLTQIDQSTNDQLEIESFQQRIARDRWYCRKRIYGGPKTHDEEGNPILVERYVGTTATKAMQPVEPTESATAVILVGYCPDTLAHYHAIFDEAKRSFPELTPFDVTCGKVTQSSSVKGFTIILFRVPNRKPKYEGHQPFDGWDYYDSHIDFNF